MAKPRIFVSSTYYDLKYVRERLERFISSYCFEPILFESDEVFFNPNLKLDESCYKEVETCHMMLLIVGGRYGSLATEIKEKYEEEYISITNKEYKTAKKRGLPVMVFVEQNVYAEYKTYMANKAKLPSDFKFAFVDDVRIFEFISTLEQGAIKVFGKVEDIERYFSHQIAGMLLAHLKDLQEKKANIEIKNAVDEIQLVSQSMKEMLNLVAAKILKEEHGKYEDLLRKQNESLIDFFIELVDQNIFIKKKDDIKEDEIKNYAKEIYQICYDKIFNETMIKEIDSINYKYISKLQQECSIAVNSRYNNIEFSIYLYNILKRSIQIMDIIKNDKSLKESFEQKFYYKIINKLTLSF